ncbi:MAG TPA: isoaspartyl peptidase/L-asparaginase, partial [Acidimicrobiales bacterium]|nr:isoaspartyl peptidase/L-asparaginase [Acidimicrobiales bacterium]
MTRFGQGSSGETGKLLAPALVVHGGAGSFERPAASGGRAAKRQLEGALGEALGAGWHILNNGGGAIRAVVEAVASMEDSGAFNA